MPVATTTGPAMRTSVPVGGASGACLAVMVVLWVVACMVRFFLLVLMFVPC